MCVYTHIHTYSTHVPLFSLQIDGIHLILVFSSIIVAGAESRTLGLVSMAVIPSLLTSHLPSNHIWQYEEEKCCNTHNEHLTELSGLRTKSMGRDVHRWQARMGGTRMQYTAAQPPMALVSCLCTGDSVWQPRSPFSPCFCFPFFSSPFALPWSRTAVWEWHHEQECQGTHVALGRLTNLPLNNLPLNSLEAL